MARLLLRDLTPGTNYKIQLRAADGDSVSEWSRRFDLPTTSDATAPDVPDWAVTDEWVVADDAFVATWLPLDFGLDQNKDFDHYEITLGNGSTFVTVTTQNTSYTLTFEQNKIYFGTPSATVTAQVRSVDAVGNASAYNSLESATNPAPAAPASISVTSLYDAILVEWDAVADTDLSNYLVQVSTSGVGGTYTTVYSGSETAFTHATVTFATDHYYKVIAVDKFGSTSSAVFSGAVRPKSTFSIDTTPPSNATNLVATPGFSATRQSAYADLTWTASVSSDVAEYTIRFSTDATNWQYMKVNYDTTAVRIDDLTPDTTYYFGISTSDFSANITTYLNATVYPVTTTEDTTAPSQPAVPTVASAVQRIQVTHTGGKQSGGSLESDLDTFQVFASTTTGFTPGTTNMLGTMKWNGVNAIQTFDVPASGSAGATTETWYVVVKAVDRSGNVSAASPEATSTPGLVGTLNITELNADRIVAGSGLINNLIVKSSLQVGDASTNGIIQSWDYVNSGGTSGFYLDKDELIIKTGTIEAAAIKLQNSPNLIQSEYASFEFEPSTYQDADVIGHDAGSTLTIDASTFKFGYQSLKIVTDGSGAKNVLLGTYLTVNTVIPEDGEYIVSYWAKSTATPTITLLTATSSNASDIVTVYDTQNHVMTTSWARYERVVTLSGTNLLTNKTQIGWQVPASSTVWIDGVQIEKKTGTIAAASVWKPPGMTSINGGAITTGTIRSTGTLDLNGVILPTWAIGVDGSAQFGDLLIRGDVIVGTHADEGPDSNIQSYNYAEGVRGWIIRSDGTAEFRSVAVGSFPGDAIQPGTVGAEVFVADSVLASDIVVDGSIHTTGEMGEDVGIDGSGFHVLGPYQVEITNKALTSNIATMTTAVDHGFTAGNKLVISGVDSTFDGVFTVSTVGASNQFSYVLTASNVSSVASTGLAQSMSNVSTTKRPVLIEFPTDGTNPNIISGSLTADTLTVTVGATLRGTSGIESGAALTIASSVLAPKSAPSVAFTYNNKTITGQIGSGSGLTNGHNGNYFTASNEALTGSYYINEFDADTGDFVATRLSKVRDQAPAGTDVTNEYTVYGIVYNAVSSRYHVLEKNVSGQRSLVGRHDRVLTYDTSWALQNSYEIQGGNGVGLGWNGATLGWDFVNSKLVYSYHDGTNAKVIPLTMTSGNPTANGSTVTLAGAGAATDPVFIARINSLDGGSADRYYFKSRIPASTNYTKNYLSYDTSGTLQSNEQWPGENNKYAYAAYYDATADRVYQLGSTYIAEYQSDDSTWVASATTDIRWVGYSWYDSVGTTHETNLSPRTKVNLIKRSAMKVTITPIPVGGADAPNKARIYVADADTEPNLVGTVSTDWHLREEVVAPSTVKNIVPATSPSGAQPNNTVTNGFSSIVSTPGIIQSTSGSSFWKGDDTAQFFQLVLTSTTDVNASAGNKPPLRIGSISGNHLRIDGNEIQSMSDDDSTGTLVLQGNGGSVGMNSADNILMGGQTFTAWNWGLESTTTDANGEISVSHGLGAAGQVVATMANSGSGSYRLSVTAVGSSTFTVQVRNSSTNALAANGTSIGVRWIAIR